MALTELHTECETVRGLVYKTAWQMDARSDKAHVDPTLSSMISMANYRANRMVCQTADTIIQVHGGIDYACHKPFQHIYRHHKRYRITEGLRAPGSSMAFGRSRRTQRRRERTSFTKNR